jgi:hypothetical protein
MALLYHKTANHESLIFLFSTNNRILKLSMTLCSADIQAIQKPPQLANMKLPDLSFHRRPGKTFLLQTLLPKTKSIPVPVENLDDISSLIAKCKNVTRIGILRQMLVHEN